MSAAPDSQDRMFNHAVVEPIDAALTHEMLAFGRLHYPPGDPYTSVAYRQWLYLDNPAGAARAVLIRQRETLIGQAALVPLHCQTASTSSSAMGTHMRASTAPTEPMLRTLMV